MQNKVLIRIVVELTGFLLKNGMLLRRDLQNC